MRAIAQLILLLLCLFTAGCSSLQQQRQPVSGLFDVPLKSSLKVPVDAYMLAEDIADVRETGAIYVAPLDVRAVQEGNEEYAALMQRQFGAYMKEELGKTLAELSPDGKWTLTDDETKATVRIDGAVVRFRPQRPALRIFGKLLGWALPLPLTSRAFSSFGKGAIGIELAMRQTESGYLLAAFKDTNRKTIALYEADAYRSEAQADRNLQHWAKGLAQVCAACAHSRRAGMTLEAWLETIPLTEALTERL